MRRFGFSHQRVLHFSSRTAGGGRGSRRAFPKAVIHINSGVQISQTKAQHKRGKGLRQEWWSPHPYTNPLCPAHCLLHAACTCKQRPHTTMVIFPSPELTLNTQQIVSAEICCKKKKKSQQINLQAEGVIATAGAASLRKRTVNVPIVTENPRDVKYYSNSGHILSKQRWRRERRDMWLIALEWITSKSTGRACKWTMSNYN